MATLNREKFANEAQRLYAIVKYKEYDCIGFVKLCAKNAGCTFSSSGTNYTWRYGLSSKGDTKTYNIQVGDVVFRYYNPGDPYYALPSKYKTGAELRDVHHIGIVTAVNGGKYTVCDSRSMSKNGQREVFASKAKLAAKWTLCGTLKGTSSAAAPSVTTTTTAPTTPTPSTTTTTQNKNSKYPAVPFVATVKIKNLRLRSEPTTKGEIYGYAPKGQVSIIEVANPAVLNSWGKISVNGQVGWINLNKSYVSWKK